MENKDLELDHLKEKAKKDIELIKPTVISYNEFQFAYDLFNEKLFNNELPQVLVTFQRGKKYLGYFSPNRFAGKSIVAELAMNPDLFAVRTPADILSTFAHEMAHVWQEYLCEKKPKVGNYHDKYWAAKMEEIGLTPSDTGLPGGKKTGKSMTHYITPKGKFQDVVFDMIKDGFNISWFDQFGYNNYGTTLSAVDEEVLAYWKSKTEDPELLKKMTQVMGQDQEAVVLDFEKLADMQEKKKKRNKTRLKFTCPSCKLNMWGKPGAFVVCGECDELLAPEAEEE